MDINEFQKAAGVSLALATRWHPHIVAAMKEFGIIKPLDQAMFIAQAGHDDHRLLCMMNLLSLVRSSYTINRLWINGNNTNLYRIKTYTSFAHDVITTRLRVVFL
jgi:predicted chitinase